MLTPSSFLSLLWGLQPPGQVLVWRLPSKHSTWFTRFDNLDAFCAAHKEDDIYTGVSLAYRNAPVSAYSRTSNINAGGIAGLWADIDLAGPEHKKPGLPQTQAEVMSILLDPFPTVIIHSGHGLQAWWLFREPWLFGDVAERDEARTLTRWWHQQLAERFAKRGWALDATHDLARVLRLPGTVNHKGAPVPVHAIYQTQNRLDVVSLLGQLPASTPLLTRTLTTAISDVVLDPAAMPPLAKFEALAAISEKFMRSWLHQRQDLMDQSASSYDMSLADIAVQADWEDQEIVNLLVAHRRERGADLKLREDYYRRTIGKAREVDYADP